MSVLGGEAEGRPLLKEAEFVHEASDSRSGRACVWYGGPHF